MSLSFFKTGVIVKDESNENPKIVKNASEINGFGIRFRVRVAGIHDEKLPVEKLPFAYPIFPVVAGTGHGGASQSCNLKAGSKVILTESEPDKFSIWGNVPNYCTTQITDKDIWNYTLGYSPGANVPIFNIASNKTFGNLNGIFAQNQVPNTLNLSLTEIYKDATEGEFCPKPNPCDEKLPLGKIQKEIKSAVQGIQKARKDVKSWSSGVSNLQKDIVRGLTGEDLTFSEFLKKKAKNISDGIIKFFNGVEQNIVTTIRQKSENIYYSLFPGEKQKAKRSIETALDLVGCLFKKLGKKVFGMLVSLLSKMVDKLVNVPICFVENFATSVISKLLGALTNSLDAIVKPLESLLGEVINVVDSILEIVENLLTLISCEEKQYCPEITNWSIWGGAENNPTANIDFNKVTKNIQGLINTEDLTVDNLNDTANLDFSDIFNNTCNIGPLLCGPPTLEVFGGGGSGTIGNTIVGPTGNILGVDITYPGSGYTSAPKIRFKDACGIGGGAVGTAVLGPIPILPPELNFTATKIDNNKYNLNWTTINATRLETNFGSFGTSGSTIVTPTTKTTYTITAYNKNNASTTKTVVIDVNVSQIEKSPELTLASTFIKDNIYRINWTTENAVRISSNFNVPENTLNGNKEVSPSVPTEYTMTAYNINGISVKKTIFLSPRSINPTKPKPVDDPTKPCPTSVVINNVNIPNEYPPDEIGVVKIIIDQPGSGYLPSPDGRLGGDGRVWAEANETYILRADGTYDIPYSPGSVIQLNRCDTVVPPCEPKFVVQEKTTYIAPDCSRNPSGPTDTNNGNNTNNINGLYPNLSNGKYPVILYLCDAIVDNPGLNYSSEDEVIIEPSNGARATAEFSESGRLLRIKILSGGEGFTTRPSITIKSSTGFNASIIPVLCIDKIGTDNKDIIPYDSTKVLHVVDCPGNIYV